MVRTDPLGQSYTLTGLQAFASVNNNLAAAGDSRITDAPALEEPATMLTVTPTITAAAFTVAYTPTPLDATERALVCAGPPRSAGRGFEGDYRLIVVTAAAAASPANIFSAWSARFGAPTVGSRVFVSIQRYIAGFVSAPLNTSALVTA